LEEKAVDFILGNVKFNDAKSSLAELISVEDEIEAVETKKKTPKSKKSESEPKTKAKKKMLSNYLLTFNSYC
jgi:hypothetical protein